MSYMISFGNNINFLNCCIYSYIMTKTCPVISNYIYYNKSLNTIYTNTSSSKCLTRRYNRNKSNPPTNYYSLFLYHSPRMNNKINYFFNIFTLYIILHYIYYSNFPNLLFIKQNKYENHPSNKLWKKSSNINITYSSPTPTILRGFTPFIRILS